MASIDQQIDEAVALMKERAAQYEDDQEFPYPTYHAHRAVMDAERGFIDLVKGETGKARLCLVITMLHCALALSLLPKGGGT